MYAFGSALMVSVLAVGASLTLGGWRLVAVADWERAVPNTFAARAPEPSAA